MKVCIIDTNQLLDAPKVIEFAMRMHYAIYIPESVLEELPEVTFKNIEDNEIVKKAQNAQRMLRKHEKHYQKVQALNRNNKRFADPKILQWVIEFICDERVTEIVVFTRDKALKADVKKIASLQCMRVDCTVKASTFYPPEVYAEWKNSRNKKGNNDAEENVEGVAVEDNDDEEEDKKTFTHVYTPKFSVIRDGAILTKLNKRTEETEELSSDTNTEVKISLVTTPSGNANVLKFWHRKAQTGDSIKIFQNFNEKKRIKAGDTVSLNFITFENTKLNIHLELSHGDGASRSTETISVMRGKWQTITFTADKDYNYLSLCIDVMNDGNAVGFIDDFTITRN